MYGKKNSVTVLVFLFFICIFFFLFRHSYLRCINVSTPSCTLLIVFTLPLVEPQLKLVKSLHGSNFQLERASILIVACRQIVLLHSGVADTERVDTQLTSLFVLQSFGSCDGAVLNKKSTGDATNNDVTSNVAVVIPIL